MNKNILDYLNRIERLNNIGYDVTIIDSYDIPGGILTYGIPSFVLNKETE